MVEGQRWIVNNEYSELSWMSQKHAMRAGKHQWRHHYFTKWSKEGEELYSPTTLKGENWIIKNRSAYDWLTCVVAVHSIKFQISTSTYNEQFIGRVQRWIMNNEHVNKRIFTTPYSYSIFSIHFRVIKDAFWVELINSLCRILHNSGIFWWEEKNELRAHSGLREAHSRTGKRNVLQFAPVFHKLYGMTTRFSVARNFRSCRIIK